MVQSRKKKNKHREVKKTNIEKLKKIQKSWGIHGHYLCQESTYFVGPTVYIRDPQELRNQSQLWVQVKYNCGDSLENSSDSRHHSDFVFRPDLSTTGATNHVWLFTFTLIKIKQNLKSGSLVALDTLRTPWSLFWIAQV